MKTKGEEIMVNVWGKQTSAILTTWEEIKKLGFVARDRSFGILNDGRKALFFNGSTLFQKKNGGIDQWFVTLEKLEDLV